MGSMLLTLLWDLPFASVSFLCGVVFGTREVLTLFLGHWTSTNCLFTALFTCQTNSHKESLPRTWQDVRAARQSTVLQVSAMVKSEGDG